jgi:hypothetical protein
MGTTWMPPALSLFVFLGAGGPVLGLIRLLCPSRRSGWAAAAVLTLVAAAGAFAGAAILAAQPAGVWLPPAALFGLSVLLGLPCQHFFASLVALVRRPLHSPFVQAACLLIGCPTLALWSVFESFRAVPLPEEVLRNNPFAQRQFQEFNPSPLATDKGRHVKVSRPVPWPERAAVRNVAQERLLKSPDIQAKVIALEVGSAECNCHGWVFTGGLYWIPGEAIELILEDNCYQKVSAPRIGDLAIYRDENGAITHTAVVRAMIRDGLVLVESKWGELGPFLHPVDVHPYDGSAHAYHRSQRDGHLLAKAPEVAAGAVGAVVATPAAPPQARQAIVALAEHAKPSVGPEPLFSGD